jgi:hypothetical protein
MIAMDVRINVESVKIQHPTKGGKPDHPVATVKFKVSSDHIGTLELQQTVSAVSGLDSAVSEATKRLGTFGIGLSQAADKSLASGPPSPKSEAG